MEKFGDKAKPFRLCFPKSSPNSVLIKGDDGDFDRSDFHVPILSSIKIQLSFNIIFDTGKKRHNWVFLMR